MNARPIALILATAGLLAAAPSAFAEWSPEVKVPEAVFGELSSEAGGSFLRMSANTVTITKREGAGFAASRTVRIGDRFDAASGVQCAADGTCVVIVGRNRRPLPGRVRAAVIPNDGSGYVRPLTISPSKRSAVSPTLAVGPDGSAIAAWAYRDSASTGWYVQVATRAPGAARFGPRQTLSAPGPNRSAYDRPLIHAAAGGGRFAVAWNFSDMPVVVRSTGEDGAFGAPQELRGAGRYPQVSLAVSPDGRETAVAYASSQVQNEVEKGAWVTSAASGTPLPEPTQLSGLDLTEAPALAYGTDGSQVVAWRESDSAGGWRLMARTRDSGAPLSDPQQISPPGAQVSEFSLAAGPAGKAVVTWFAWGTPLVAEMGIDSSPGITFASTRTSSGSAFSAPVRLSDDQRSAEFPKAAVTQDGHTLVMFLTMIQTAGYNQISNSDVHWAIRSLAD